MQDTFTPISEVGEFGLIDRLESVLGEPANPSLVMSIGDDAAVYRAGADKVSVVTSDALIEGVHFDLSFIPMEHLGAKSLMVNLSDVIAMNALPKFATVVLGIPNHVSVEMAEELYRGIRKVCEAYDVTIIGGDITGARQLTISITAIGEALEEELAYRKGAEPGDVLCVTGDLGSAYAGLKVLLRERAELQEKKEEFVPTIRQYQYVVNRNLAPVARLGVIQSWREAGFRPHAMIDVSDGLASEVNHLCRRSGCGAIVRASDIPLHDQTHRVATEFGESPTLYQLQGGEDYELLFAAPESELKKLKDSSYAVIGEFVAREEGVVLQHADGTEEELKPIGWDHFA